MSSKSIPDSSAVVTLNGVSFSHGEIFRVVDEFYTRIQNDPVLKVPFQSVHDWPEHIERLTHFWWIRLGGKPYLFSHYSPVAKHFFAGFNEEFLARWLDIFRETLRANLDSAQSTLWGEIAGNIGNVLSIKNEMFGRAYKAQHEGN